MAEPVAQLLYLVRRETTGVVYHVVASRVEGSLNIREKLMFKQIHFIAIRSISLIEYKTHLSHWLWNEIEIVSFRKCDNIVNYGPRPWVCGSLEEPEY